MKCILNGREVLYPCSHNCPLFGDCTVMFQRDTKPVVTNADRIRSMSDEELATMFAMLRADLSRLDAMVRPYSGSDVNDNYDWLKKPAEGG